MGQAAGKNVDKEMRRREILETAFAEFSERGYAAASMGAIARRAHASKETLYSWFQNKENLFNTVFATRLEGLSSRVQQTAARDPSPETVLPVVVEDLIRFAVEITPLFRAVGAGGPTGQIDRLVGATIVKDRKRLVDYFEWCRDQGFIDFDDDPFEIASLFVAMGEGEWVMRLETGMIDEITDDMILEHGRRVTRMFLRGLTA